MAVMASYCTFTTILSVKESNKENFSIRLTKAEQIYHLRSIQIIKNDEEKQKLS